MAIENYWKKRYYVLEKSVYFLKVFLKQFESILQLVFFFLFQPRIVSRVKSIKVLFTCNSSHISAILSEYPPPQSSTLSPMNLTFQILWGKSKASWPNKCILPTICRKTGLHPPPPGLPPPPETEVEGPTAPAPPPEVAFCDFLTEIRLSSMTGPCCRSRNMVAWTTLRNALSLAEVTSNVRRLSIPRVSALHFPWVSISVSP